MLIDAGGLAADSRQQEVSLAQLDLGALELLEPWLHYLALALHWQFVESRMQRRLPIVVVEANPSIIVLRRC